MTAAVTRGVTIETTEEGSQIHEGLPNLVAGESSSKRSTSGSDDLKVLSMDMDRDLKDMDLEAERPTQPLGDGDVAKWVTARV